MEKHIYYLTYKYMRAKILDKHVEKQSTCFLCSISLEEYITNLPEDYRDYDVQREIVSNVYLDNLVNTVLNKNHIPPIVLIAENYSIEENTLIIQKFKILDGLQRTYRLNAIWKTLLLYNKEIKENPELLTYSKFQLSKNYSSRLHEINSSTRIFQSIIDFTKNNSFKHGNGFNANYQWFEIWTNLDPDDEVDKMLVLNAGHKPVKIKHQLELIFRNTLPIFYKIGISGFSIIREKEVSSIQFSKQRNVGEFHFSTLISSILSIREGKSITTNSSLIQKIQNTEFDMENDNILFSFQFLKRFVKFLMNVDIAITKAYKNDGTKWFGREVTLVGIFGALGKYCVDTNTHIFDALNILESLLVDKPLSLAIPAFETMRNSLDLGKVNIGNVNKNAIYEGILELLEKKTKTINWEKHF